MPPFAAYAYVVATTALLLPNAANAQTQVPLEMKKKAMAIAEVCRADFDRLCGDVRPGGGRILACMESHGQDLTAQCRAQLPNAEVLRSRAVQAGILPEK